MRRVPLGPFDLHAPLGHGGMGVVWKGVHRDTGVAVAVKVITRAALLDDKIRKSFRNEVKAVAGLDHPGIIWVFDTGEVDDEAARASDGKLVASGPYLAMEHASGGTLQGWTPPHWEAARDMMLEVLDALGHAHARGVLHRDMKPPNVLRCTARDPRPGWKLVDFGIATLLDQTIEESINQGIIGTLAYMAPEQIRATWRDYGPWTDLYAFGCLLYRVIGGHRAFKETKGTALMIAQLNKKPVPLEPQITVPQGFHEWIERLLLKDTRDRFQNAADAALALSQLGNPVDTTPMAPIPLGSTEDDVITQPMSPDEVPTAREVQQPQLPRGGRLGDAFTLPLSWRRSESPRPPPRLVGAGLGLFDLRAIPMVGRHDERDALWKLLRASHKSGRAAVVCLHGAAGVGKSRLAAWVGETARQLAGITYLKAQGRAGDPPQSLLTRTLHRELKTARLEGEVRLERIQHELRLQPRDVPLARGIAAVLAPDGQADGLRVEGAARYAVVRRAMELMARERPVVCVLDDVHHAPDGFAFARHLAEAQAVQPSPILLVLTWRDEAVAEDPELQREVAALAAQGATTMLHVGPMSDAESTRLVQELLPLERSLQARVEERIAGNPLFAVQLVRDWVRQGKLVEGASGFELQDTGPIIASVEEVWRTRVERALAGMPDEASQLLELAAVLGMDVREVEWQRVGDDPKGKYAALGRVMFVPNHGRWRSEIVRRMAAARLVEENEEGFSFGQEMVREVLFSMAAEKGRLAKHHRACARMLLYLDDAGPKEAPVHSVRIGRHLLEGAYPSQAIPYLQEGVGLRMRQGGPKAALPVLALLEQALKAAGVPEEELPWVELFASRASIFNGLERFDDARHWASRAESAARAGKHRVLEARAVLELGRVQMAEREAQVADRTFARAESLLRESDDPALLGEVNYSRSLAARYLQDASRARAHAMVAARYLSRAEGSRRGVARGWGILGRSFLLDRELDDADRYLEKARTLFELDADALGVAEVLTDVATVARLRKRFPEARSLLDKSVELYRQAGSPQVVHPLIERSLLALADRSWSEAWDVASDVLEQIGWQGQGALLVSTHAAMAAAAAGAGRWTELDVHLERVREGLSRIEVLEPDLAWTLDLTGDLATSAGRVTPARKAWKLALGLQNTVDPERARVTQRKLASALGG